MHLSPRPSPRDVHAYFAAPLTDAALRAAVHLLDRDPNWLVISTPGSRTWELTLLYGPEGSTSVLHLERVTATAPWRRTS